MARRKLRCKSGLLRPLGIRASLETLMKAIDCLPRKISQVTLTHGILQRIALITETHKILSGVHITPEIFPGIPSPQLLE